MQVGYHEWMYFLIYAVTCRLEFKEFAYYIFLNTEATYVKYE